MSLRKKLDRAAMRRDHMLVRALGSGSMSGENVLAGDMLHPSLSTLVDILEFPLIGASPASVINVWNRRAQDLLGYGPAEILGQPLSLLMPEAGSGSETALIQQLQRVGRVQAEASVRAKDGTVLDLRLTYVAVRNNSPDLQGILILVEESAERKHLEQADENELFLEVLLSTSEDPIIYSDLNGIITRWNPAAEQLFGYTAQEMVGKPVRGLCPSDRQDEDPETMKRIRNGERLVQYETQCVSKTGRVINVSMKVSSIRNRTGQIIGALKIVRDSSERERWRKAERAESFLGALVASADDAIISLTLDGIVSNWNTAAEKLYGYSESEIVGRPVMILIPVDHPEEGPQILERIRRGESIDHYETKRMRKNGSFIDVALTVFPIKDRLGRVIGASKISREISEQKRAASREREALLQAQQARKEAEAANRIKDEFLATVSHELRTPMTAILGWSGILTSGPQRPDVQQRAIEIIDRNARSQAQLIDDLLDISRIISGKLRVEFSPVDLSRVVMAAVETLRPTAEAKRILIKTLLDSGTEPIMGDRERLQQIVWNLLSNALRFTGTNGLVEIKLRSLESEVELTVSDNGIGIKPEFLPRVFDRFTRAESSTTRSTGGLGMGLAIVKSLVELHGGAVSVASAGEGRGAKFTVTLPLTEKPNRAPGKVPALLMEKVDSRPKLAGLKVLVVDDDGDTRDLLRFVFNGAGAHVETADGAAAAFETFDRWQPDILISDIGMPGMDGYELIRVLRKERGSDIPAIALTAMARIDDRRRALGAGYQLHVAKPVEPSVLIRMVADLSKLVRPQVPSGSPRSEQS